MIEDSFRIKTYGFGELAQLYLPNIKPVSASKRLRAWIKGSPGLKKELKAIGYRSNCRVLTPEMTKTIVRHVGEP